MLLEAVVADLLEILLRYDPSSTRRHRGIKRHEIGPGLLQVEAHQVGIDCLDLLDFFLEELCTLTAVAFEAKLHILGSERVAVVESDPLAQLELICQAILALAPGFSQTGRHRVARHGFDQGIVQSVEKQKRRNRDGFGRVKVRGRNGEVNRLGYLPLRLSGHVSKVNAADEQQSQTDAE